METEYYYRWSATVQWLGGGGHSVYFHCEAYPVIKKTRAGVFVEEASGRKHFILNDANKKWAAPTKQEAWLNYKNRSRNHLRFAQNNLDKIKCAQAAPQFQSDEFPTEVLNEVQSENTFTFG
jgi:hypothetical protein